MNKLIATDSISYVSTGVVSKKLYANRVSATNTPSIDEKLEKFQFFVTEIDKFVNLENQDEEVELPNSDTAKITKESLKELIFKNSIYPAFVNYTNEGSISLEFNYNNYYLLEFFNTGEIVFLKRNENKEREAFDITPKDLPIFIERIACSK